MEVRVYCYTAKPLIGHVPHIDQEWVNFDGRLKIGIQEASWPGALDSLQGESVSVHYLSFLLAPRLDFSAQWVGAALDKRDNILVSSSQASVISVLRPPDTSRWRRHPPLRGFWGRVTWG